MRAAYGAVLLGPLALMLVVHKAGAQGRLVVFADALGFAALSLLLLQILTSGRWADTTRHFGLRRVLTLHRAAGAAVLLLVVVHVVVLMADDPSRLALLDWSTAPMRARAGAVALLGLVGLAGTTVWRRRLSLSYGQWRAIHLALTAVVLAGAFEHIDLVAAYTAAPVVRWLVLAVVLGGAVALFWTRIAGPYATALKPYRVTEVRTERGDAVSVELAPVGHDGLRFAPGQFARLRAAHCHYGMDDHPFTLSSGAHRPDRPAFTVKALGDFSASLAGLGPGTRVLVDGPHGEAARASRALQGRLLLAAGIGITPAMSLIRTAAAAGDPRPLLLLYGSRRWEDVTFREELAALESRLANLRVVHVLSRPEPAWTGERGRVDAALVARLAPPGVHRWSALACGPPAMVAGAEAVLRELGMPPSAIQIEGFG
jgi:predicted ferric reductase